MSTKLANGIPTPVIQLSLIKDEPSKVDPNELQKELNQIGLTCEHTLPENLKKYIKETVDTFSDGSVQSYGFFKFDGLASNNYGATDTCSIGLNDIVEDLTDIHANWKPTDKPYFKAELSAIGFPEHFDALLKTGFFTGVKVNNTYSGTKSTVEAIKSLFTETALNISSTMVNGLDKDTMEATFNKIIAPTPESDDYDSGVQNRSLYLIENYNPKIEQCDALGVMNIEWRLRISSYKDKKTKKHKYSLEITVRNVTYSSIDTLKADYNRVISMLKDKIFFKNVKAIPVPSGVEIFDTLPPANATTFDMGLPLEQESSDYVDVIILSHADLQSIGSIDNSTSDCAASYSKSVTKGFTFSMGQKISSEFTFDLNAIIEKASVKVGLELSFNEQWNTSVVETVNFNVPAGKKAFFYQGYTMASILRMDCKKCTFSYVSTAKMLTPTIVTSDKPLDGPAKVENKRALLKSNANGEKPLWLRMASISD
jgi:hypothetical protein